MAALELGQLVELTRDLYDRKPKPYLRRGRRGVVVRLVDDNELVVVKIGSTDWYINAADLERIAA